MRLPTLIFPVFFVWMATLGGSGRAEAETQRFLCVFDQHVSQETGHISRDSPLAAR